MGSVTLPVTHTGDRHKPSDVSMPTPSKWLTMLVDAAAVIAVMWTIPLAILAVGTPVALVIVSLLWLGRLALSAF